MTWESLTLKTQESSFFGDVGVFDLEDLGVLFLDDLGVFHLYDLRVGDFDDL